MHDMSLGGPIDIGGYAGPMLEGKPIHTGNCEDGVYGCRRCNRAARQLTDEQLKSAGLSPTQSCDWCNAETPLRDMRGLSPWDEPSCYYEVCKSCNSKHAKELQAEIDYDNDKYGDD